MNHFPVTNSNLSAQHLSFFLQEKYGLTKKATCRLIKAGINDTYLVEDHIERFIFRVYSLNWRTRTDITEEINLLTILHKHHIPVSYPLADRDHTFIQLLKAPEGDRFSVLFSYANGQKKHILPAETHFQIGQLIARLHQVTHNRTTDRVTYTSEVILMDSLKQVSLFLAADTEEMNFMRSAQRYLLEEFTKADASQIRHGIVHLDIWFDNLNLTEENEATLFDFDFCGNGWLCLDLAYYILQLHNIERYEANDYQPKVDSFMNGYQSISSVSREEKRLIPMLGVSLYFFYLGIQCQRYENWSNSFLNENYLKRYINGLIKKYYDIYRLGENKID